MNIKELEQELEGLKKRVRMLELGLLAQTRVLEQIVSILNKLTEERK